MPVKYHCPKCHRRFTEWGAERTGFKCPHDQWCPKDAAGTIELVRGGALDDKPAKRPTLKRPIKKAVVADEVDFDVAEEVLVPDVEEVDDVMDEAVLPEEFVHADEEEVSPVNLPAGDALGIIEDEEEADLDVPEDLAFGETPPQLAEEVIDDLGETTDDWTR